MKSFVINCIYFSSIFFGVLSILYFKPANSDFNDSYIAAHIDKNIMLELDTTDSRIIIIGGSNATFGIKSELISEVFSKRVINYSLHAGLGMNFILNKSEDFIKSGDVIILFPEYQQFFDDYYFGEEILAWYLVNGSFKDLSCLTFKQLRAQFPNIIRMLTHKIQLTKTSSGNELYSRKNFNEYGDFIGHLDRNINTENKILAHDMTNSKLNEKALSRLVCFSENVKDRNASLFISFPSIQKETYLKNIIQIDEVYKALSSNKLILIDEPGDNIFSDSLLFDSPYHLNWKGREIRTKNLITKLNKKIK